MESQPSTDSDSIEIPSKYSKNYDLHELRFDTTKRALSHVPLPRSNTLEDAEFWNENDLPRVDVIKDHLIHEGRIKKSHFELLLQRVTAIFAAEENIVNVPHPTTVCGDVHGQFYDLVKLLRIGGNPEDTTYLWLGDYVDRGDFSCEVLILLYSYKILYPQSFFMLRGNHECRHLTEYFTFKEECIYKYDLEIYELVMASFDALPIAAIVNQQFFCVHGGLSPHFGKDLDVNDIRKIDRFQEPPSFGLFCDLLWADPMEKFNSDTDADFVSNELRKTSYSFSYQYTCKFLTRNKFLSVIRAHEAQDLGYRMYEKCVDTGFPALITIFSAPNYLNSYNNKGAILRFEKNVLNIKQFNCAEHPYYLPSFVNVFEWSLPFVAEKLTELLLVFLNLVNDVEEDERESDELFNKEETDKINTKVETVGKMLQLYKKLREQRETIVYLGPLIPNSDDASKHHPLVSSSQEELMRSMETFEGVKAIDRINEARPSSPTGLSPPKQKRSDERY